MTKRFRIVSGSGAVAQLRGQAQGMRASVETGALSIHVGGADPLRWNDGAGATYLLFGDLVGIRRPDGSLVDKAQLALYADQITTPRASQILEGRFVLVRIVSGDACEIWTDRFGGADVYCQAHAGGCVIASDLELMPAAAAGSEPNPLAYAHALTVYGSRPAKKDTYYRGVQRIGVEEWARLSGGKIEVLDRPFSPSVAGAYGDREHHEYADAFLESLRANGSSSGNVVYLSSGWDSTSILAGLVHVFGPRKVRAVIGRMRYAERSGVINQFELDRARAMAEFFRVPLEVCEFDYRTRAEEVVDAALPLFRSQQFASVTGLNHWLLAQHAARSSSGDEVVFAGEMSDGAHNLGFSQFVTIFHPSMEFREYSDKMASYLFGPTFLKLLQEGKHTSDPIWNLFRMRAGDTRFDEPAADPAARVGQMLASFFLRGSRMPLCSLENSKFLTASGRSNYADAMERSYLGRAAREANPETLYSWYLHLYNSFHWQGSTVATLPHTAAAHGLRCALPFHDGRVQDFLSAMPESWGRGLDMKPTKYPLKWMLQNRIRYPMHLQVGPHSYLYDVDPSFSHSAELLFASSLGEMFKDRLRAGHHRAALAGGWVDDAYVERIVTRFVGGEEFRGQEMNDVMLLGLLAMTGRIGDR